MTGKPMLEQDEMAWKTGYAAGLVGDRRCPYSDKDDTIRSWSWSAGWIEGDAVRQKGGKAT